MRTASQSANGVDDSVRLVVDLNRCLGYAQCCFLAPGVFELKGQEALRYHPQADAGETDAVRRAAASCPVQAISVQFPAGEEPLGNSGRELRL